MIAAIAVAVYLAACSVAVWTVPPRGVTWLGLLNFCVLQWFGVRRARVCENGVQVGWTWNRGVVPLTGWWSPFRYFGGRR